MGRAGEARGGSGGGRAALRPGVGWWGPRAGCWERRGGGTSRGAPLRMRLHRKLEIPPLSRCPRHLGAPAASVQVVCPRGVLTGRCSSVSEPTLMVAGWPMWTLQGMHLACWDVARPQVGTETLGGSPLCTPRSWRDMLCPPLLPALVGRVFTGCAGRAARLPTCLPAFRASRLGPSFPTHLYSQPLWLKSQDSSREFCPFLEAALPMGHPLGWWTQGQPARPAVL